MVITILVVVAAVALAFAIGDITITRPQALPAQSNVTSEEVAEVVRITEIVPHPNADRLEIAHFELKGSGPSAYDVVIQKDTYQPGDLAAYLSVDCIVPTSHPEFAFLKERLDGKDKEKYRLKAARLRGVFSQGLLVKPPAGAKFGDPMSAELGVTYHRADELSEPTAPGTPRKRKPQPWPVYGVESLKKVPRLFEDGERVFVTEKIHGTNFRFGWVRRKIMGIPCGWKFRVGSHRVMKGDGSPGFYGKDLWAQAAAENDLAKRTAGWKGYLFVGELYGKTYEGANIQDLTYGLGSPRLAIFDVQHRGSWLDYDERSKVCGVVGFNTVPLIYDGPFHAGCLAMAEGKSTIHAGTIREGVVIESEKRDRKAKFVSQGYLLRKAA